MIPQQIIEEIKSRNSIEDVISGYVSLKRAGSNMVGRCPFHSEKTPSFTVFSGTSSYYCFGCGAGGDVVRFIMSSENLSYVEALQYLAKRAGIEIPEDNDPKRYAGMSRARVLEINRDAARYFYECFTKSREAQEYAARRGLTPALIKHFGIGYAPDSFQELPDHLQKKGYTQEEMKTAFLAGISEKSGRSYAMFRGRLMFPVINVKGEIIAFGGRIIGEGEPKYLNTSETPVFNKRRNLFALNFAKNHCGEQMILCEGYMDVVSLHGAGFENAVATCGTAITSDQARLMKNYTKEVIISYDADEAGQRAADKAFRLLGEAGLEARLLKVENAKDPDEYIKKFGKPGFEKLLSASRTRFDFLFSNLLARYDGSTPDGKVKIAQESTDIIGRIWSEVERDIYTRQVADKLEIPFEVLKNDVKRKVSRNERTEKREQSEAVMREAQGYGDRVNPDRLRNVGAAGAEEAILGILATYPERIPEASGGEVKLTPEDFVTEFNRRVYEKMLSLGADFNISVLSEVFTADEVSRVVRYTVSRMGLTENGMPVIVQCAQKLRDCGKPLSFEELLERKRKKK